jgi:hypothetical protein
MRFFEINPAEMKQETKTTVLVTPNSQGGVSTVLADTAYRKTCGVAMS